MSGDAGAPCLAPAVKWQKTKRPLLGSHQRYLCRLHRAAHLVEDVNPLNVAGAARDAHADSIAQMAAQIKCTFTMDAAGVLSAAMTAIPKCAAEVMRRNGVGVDDIDVVIPHQPSINLLWKVAWDTGIPFQKFRTNMDRYANTSGATIPIVLNETLENGGIKKDDLVMFAAAGVGFTAGAALYRWH